MILDSLHLIKGDGINLAYFYPSFGMIIINDLSYDVLNTLKSKRNVACTASKYNLEVKEIEEMLQSMECSLLARTQNQKRVNKNVREISRITLHVSNDCNLRCKYCYAEGGNYKQSRELMTMNVARSFIEFCEVNFDSIGHIVFFGGEPMLNIDVMEYICNTFEMHYKEKRTNFLPEFGIITNGTILNDRVLSFVKAHLSFITVSIDGPQEVNDANRVFVNGKGSYDKIARFIREVTNETTIPIQYEATFTQYHVEKHYSYDMVRNALFKEFGIKGTVMDELSLEKRNKLNYWTTFNYESLVQGNYKNVPEGFWSILGAIANKHPKQMCQIAQSMIAVGVDGEIYPCHMNNGEKWNSLGTILGENIFNDSLLAKNNWAKFHLKDNDECKNCWANYICGGCSKKWFYNEDDKVYIKSPNKELCDLNQMHLEKILLLISRIRKDEYQWSLLLKRVSSHTTNCD